MQSSHVLEGRVEPGSEGVESGAVGGGGGGVLALLEEVTMEHGVEIPEGDIMIEDTGTEGIASGEEAAKLPGGGDGGDGGFFFSAESVPGRMGWLACCPVQRRRARV